MIEAGACVKSILLGVIAMLFGGSSGFQVRNGNSCGSASCLRVTNGNGYFLTNAHVAGTKLGHVVSVTGVNIEGADVTVRGVVFAAGYIQGKSVDWAVIIVQGDALETIRDLCAPKLVGPADGYDDWLTIGSPRCERPSVRRLGSVVDDGPVGRGVPAAISGQSGSGIFADGLCVGLITWSDGRSTLFQTAEALGMSLDASFVEELRDPRCPASMQAAWELPANAVPCCEYPVACEDGYHGPSSGVVQVLCLAGEGDLLADDSVDEIGFDWLSLLIKLLPLILEFLAERGISETVLLREVVRCKSR